MKMNGTKVNMVAPSKPSTQGKAGTAAKGAVTSVCVYCGSGKGLNPAYAVAARKLGRGLAQAGIRLVYGGGSLGLMGEVAKSALGAGGKVTGIIPEFLGAKEKMLQDVDELIVVGDMHARKKLMFERSDAFVALPGGIGTLEELVEQLTWSQLGQHTKLIVVANIEGFWEPLLALLAHMRETAFVREGLSVNVLTADRVERFVEPRESARVLFGEDTVLWVGMIQQRSKAQALRVAEVATEPREYIPDARVNRRTRHHVLLEPR